MLPTHSSQMHLHNCFWRIGNKTGYVILKFSSEFSLIINEGIILSFEPLNCLHLLKQIQYLYNAWWFLPLPSFLIYFLFFHHLSYHRKWINASEDRRSLDPSECPGGMQVPGEQEPEFNANFRWNRGGTSTWLFHTPENDLIAGY